MPKNTTFSRHCLVLLALFTLLLLMACGKKETTIPAEQAKQQAAAAPGVSSPDELPASGAGVVLPVGFGRSTGDLDQMAKQRNIRALVLLNPIGFFYDNGLPKGVNYEALEEFQKFANQDRKSTRLNSSHLGISYAVFCLK